MKAVGEQRSREELLSLILVAVGSAKAEVLGNESYVRLCDEVMFPFLEREIERETQRASEELCHVGSATSEPCQLPAVVVVNHDTPDYCLYHALALQVDWHLSEIKVAIEAARDNVFEDIRIVLGDTRG